VKTDIASTIAFAGFVVFGLLVIVAGRFAPPPIKRRFTHAFLGFALLASFTAGLTQHNMWPFSSWPVLAYPMRCTTLDSPSPRIMAVDAGGREYNIDYRAWNPISLEELLSWLNLHFSHLDPAEQDRVGKYFLDRANSARQDALSPQGLAYPNRWLGPLTAPTHMLHPAIWSQVETVPRSSFVAIRIYNESWDLDARRLDPSKVTRVLAYEYPHK
jgi:hypothetical protein